MEAATCHSKQLNLDFSRGRGIRATFNNVLFPGTCCLKHLVISTVSFGNVTLKKEIGQVIDSLCLMENIQFPVACLGRAKSGVAIVV